MARRRASAALIALLCSGCFALDIDLPEDLSPIVVSGGPFTVTAPQIWPMKALFDGQTAVPLEPLIDVRGVHWDLTDPPQGGWVSLFRAADDVELPLDLELLNRFSGTFRVTPQAPLKANTSYLLAFPGCRFMPHVLCPNPIRFETTSAPRLLARRRVGNGLVLVFSEPLDADAIRFAERNVDLVILQDGYASSVVDADEAESFALLQVGRRLTIAPLPDTVFDVVLGPEVRASTGAALAEGGLVIPIVPATLEVCHRRDDYPMPCIDQAAAVEVVVTFECPFVPVLDVP